jgi:hypothetical protein
MRDRTSEPAQGIGAATSRNPVHLWLGVAAACLITFVAWVLIEAALTPWARSLSGEPTLTGEWLGEMMTPTGVKQLVWIELDHAVSSSPCFGCSSIDGQAATCNATNVHRYEVLGSTETWDGSLFHLKTSETEESVVHLLYLEGKWDGDKITLTTTLVAPGIPQTTRWQKNEAGEETTTVVGGHPDTRAPIVFSMTRATRGDFEARCIAGRS